MPRQLAFDIAITNIVYLKARQRGWGNRTLRIVLIAKYNGGGAMKEVLNAKNAATHSSPPKPAALRDVLPSVAVLGCGFSFARVWLCEDLGLVATGND